MTKIVTHRSMIIFPSYLKNIMLIMNFKAFKISILKNIDK